ncbi:MAG: hypothetical protein M3417_03610 [Actinomycetota bacterium]|nr:hypothetical protein [Actinomycetota bacterium]
MEGAPQTLIHDANAGEALAVPRYFTSPGVHPFESVEWELRDALIGFGGNVSFEQAGVEFPSTWSQNATNIVAQKYFRGKLDSPSRERSVKQMIGRVAGTIADWGRQRGYFATAEDGDAFEAELTYILLHQMAAFNSPVWFNVGFEESPQCSACQPFHQKVSTPEGMVAIGELVEQEQVGREVYDADGVTRIVAVKHNGTKPVFRVTLRNGQWVEATADHVVKAAAERRTTPRWLRVGELEAGMRMHLHPHRAKVAAPALVPVGADHTDAPAIESADSVAVAEAALAGWLQADGFVGQYEQGTKGSLTVEFRMSGPDERSWVEENLDIVFPDVHRKVRVADTLEVPVERIRLSGEDLRPFVERWGLLARGTDIRVPEQLFTASWDEIVSYLRSIFQADGWISVRRERGCESARIGFAVIGERWAQDVQLLLNVVGIYSGLTRQPERRTDRHDMHELSISIGSERARFAELVGFVDQRKSDRLLASLDLRNPERCPDLREEEVVSVEPLGAMAAYDIQTESGEYLANNIAVHNCFILSVEDTMDSILDWNTREGRIFRGGSGSGINLSNIRGSMEPLSKGGTASGPVSFMRGADAWAGTIKSGGKTRRAAKMVVLDVDHPDIREFIWCKAKEEDKARALAKAGFDMSLDGDGMVSIQYQNANNSVRVTHEFMRAVENGDQWRTTSRATGEPIGEPIEARELMREIADAAWRCADPGVQYDTTINQWHTSPESGRINASNPCFPADARVHTTQGLMRFGELHERWAGGETDIEVYTHRATAGENGSAPRAKGEGVIATVPLRVMENGVKRIVRLRFANGQELRCTPNHKLWTTNRAYVAAEDLTTTDRVLFSDSATPASAASWTLPVAVEALARSAVRGGSVLERPLPRRWSDGLGELLGHLTGDGAMTDSSSVWVYGEDDIADGLDESHRGMLSELVGHTSRQAMDNGCVQLRVGSSAVRELLAELGVTSARAHDKRVPASIYAAPVEVQAAYLRGLFGADGCVARIEGGGKATRYVGLGSRSDGLLRDVLRLLSTFGVRGTIYRTTEARESTFSYVRADGSEITYAAREGFDLRISGTDMERFAEAIGFSTPRKNAALATLLTTTTRYQTKIGSALVSREDDGQEVVYNLSEPLHHSYMVDGAVVANCSEYMHVDDSACNLSSLNLMKFRRPDGAFDVESFEHAVDIMLLAQEIVVGPSSYPTEEIGVNARAFRQLGLGYANLGAFLMANGLPYDSDAGRGVAAAITSLMTGRGYLQSAKVAAAIGPYERYAENRDAHNGVMRMHRDASYAIPDASCTDTSLLEASRTVWDQAVSHGELHGYRNAQATVLAPTGTISFLMDCDTTGVEPDFSLVKYKTLVGGGNMTIANRTVPLALETLGYAPEQIEQIEAHVAEHNSMTGAPGLKAEHMPIFDVAVGENAIAYMGHITMMGAVQPFLSGAISKCIVGDSLLATEQGLIRIGSLYSGEDADSFRPMELTLASLAGARSTDAFYYGGERPVRRAVLCSGHQVVGTPNHRVLVAGGQGLEWRRLDELEPGDRVATKYGDELWASVPPSLADFTPSPAYGCQKRVTVPTAMTADLAFLLGAYAAEGHLARSNWTLRIANADEDVLARLVACTQSLFDVTPRVSRDPGKCPFVDISSKTLVELFDYLGTGSHAANKRIPDAVLASPRPMVLAFLEGLTLDSYLPASLPKWAICLASNDLLDDLQAVLTNLGVVNSRVRKYDATYDKCFEEVYVTGQHAQRLVSDLRFPELHKRLRAAEIAAGTFGGSAADVVPGITGRELYGLIPQGSPGRSGRGSGRSKEFSYLKDARTREVSRTSLARVAAVEGVELPDWLDRVLDDNLYFSPVVSVEDAGSAEVFDVSVPGPHAFVANGIVNHNTVNMPAESTVEDIADAYLQAWHLGVKALAIYRDGSKNTQVLGNIEVAEALVDVAEIAAREGLMTPDEVEARVAMAVAEATAQAATVAVAAPEAPAVAASGRVAERRRMQRERQSITHKFSIGGHEGYITAGMYEDGTVGEIFLTDIGKEGSTMRGMMNSFATAISIALQYGVPLETLVQKFAYMRFEPEGITQNPEIPFAKSMPDYIMRWLASRFLDADDQEELGILTPEVRRRKEAQDAGLPSASNTASPAATATPSAAMAPAARPTEVPPAAPAVLSAAKKGFGTLELGPACGQCGGMMQRTGSCYTCPSCGNNTGCG